MYTSKIIVMGICLMLRGNSRFWIPVYSLVIAISQHCSAFTFVGFQPVAESDTIFVFDIFTVDRWVDGQPKLLLRSYGYPDPSQKNFIMGKDYIYSILSRPPLLESQYVLTDSFDTGALIAGDFDADGNVELLGNHDFYPGQGTQVSILEFTGGKWKEYKEAIPFDIAARFSAELFDNRGDDFIFAFGIDTLHCDTCAYDIESSSPMGLIYGNWDSGKFSLHVDSTFHYALQSMGASKGETTYVFAYEAIFDSITTTDGSRRQMGCVAKYRFDKQLTKLERLYFTECIYFGGGFTDNNGSSVYVRDSLIVVLDDSAIQWFVDDGKSLKQILIQWTPFPCFNPVLFDIDGDGEKDLVCTEPIATIPEPQTPNWVIKAYKILEQK